MQTVCQLGVPTNEPINFDNITELHNHELLQNRDVLDVFSKYKKVDAQAILGKLIGGELTAVKIYDRWKSSKTKTNLIHHRTHFLKIANRGENMGNGSPSGLKGACSSSTPVPQYQELQRFLEAPFTSYDFKAPGKGKVKSKSINLKGASSYI